MKVIYRYFNIKINKEEVENTIQKLDIVDSVYLIDTIGGYNAVGVDLDIDAGYHQKGAIFNGNSSSFNITKTDDRLRNINEFGLFSVQK